MTTGNERELKPALSHGEALLRINELIGEQRAICAELKKQKDLFRDLRDIHQDCHLLLADVRLLRSRLEEATIVLNEWRVGLASDYKTIRQLDENTEALDQTKRWDKQ